MSKPVDQTAPPRKPARSKLGLWLGLMLAFLLGGTGFWATYSGLVLSHLSRSGRTSQSGPDINDIAYLALVPIVISLPPGGSSKHLKFTGQLEVPRDKAAEVEALMPRIIDVLNSYLRAIDLKQVEDPGSLTRLRAQMLRRVQVVTGDGRIRDLLVSEFLLN